MLVSITIIISFVIISGTIIGILFLLEENLHKKFVTFGDFNNKTLNDFTIDIRPPNSTLHMGNHIIANWCTNNNWTKQNYSINLIFNVDGKFITKNSETFY